MAKTKEGCCVIAIDPGIGGAIAWLWRGVDGERFTHVERMPIQQKKSGRNEVDARGLLELLDAQTPDVPKILGVVEQVSAMPGQGVSSMFSLGDSYGAARMALTYYCHSIDQVASSRWKHRMGLTKNKEYSLTLARRYFPERREALKLKKDEGKAEALLLAKYADENLFLSGIY